MTRLRPYVSRITTAGLALALAACAVQGPTTGPRKATPSAKPKPVGTAASAAPTATPATGVAKLQRPVAGTTALQGRVTIDAAYALGAGGTLISDKGSGIVANNGAAVAVGGARLDAASGRLVSNNGGSVLADGAGFVAGDAPGGRAPELAGGALLAGGAVLANNGASYQLTQATPAAGTELPAAGMLVSVVNLADHRYVPLGERADGTKVYAVYTDAAGGFEVHVPAGGARNLLVVASVPGAADRRLNPNVVVASGAASLTVDELERLTTQYLRQVFTQQMAISLRTPELALGFVASENYLTGSTEDPASSRGAVTAMLRKLGDLGREAGLPEDPDQARLEAASRRAVDALLGRLDLSKALITVEDVPMWKAAGAPMAPEPITAAFRRILRTLLDGAGKRLREDPDHYAQAFLEGTINASDAEHAMSPIGDWAGKIRTPGDVAEFLLVEYAGAVRLHANVGYRRLYKDFHAALGEAEPERAANESSNTLQAAGYGTIVALARALIMDPAAAAEVRAILAEEVGSGAPP